MEEKRLAIIHAENFDEKEIKVLKRKLEEACEDWENTTILLTQKPIKVTKMNDSQWTEFQEKFEVKNEKSKQS